MPAAVDAEPVDPVARQPQERGQQGHRSHDHDQHHERRRDSGRRHERDAGESQPEDGDHDSSAGEDHGLAGCRDGTTNRLLDRVAGGQEFTVPSHEEEGVVDPDTEPDHACDLRSPTRDLDQVRHQGHRAHAERKPEQCHADRQPHRDDRPERQEQDDDSNDDAHHLAGSGLRLLEREEQVTVRLHLQRTGVGPTDHLLEPFQVTDVEVLDHGVLEADQGDTAICRHRPRPRRTGRPERERAGSIGGPDHVRQGCRWPSAARRVRPERRRRRRRNLRGAGTTHHLCGQAGRVGLRPR